MKPRSTTSLHPFRPREHAAALVFVTLALAAAYAATMPRTLPPEDAGLFSLACHFGGIAHAPGYPLYTILCWPFAHLPGLPVFAGVSLLSVAAALVTAVFIYRIAVRLIGGASAGLVAALGYGFSQVFWSQAVVPEVYTLNTAFFFALFSLALEQGAEPRAGRIHSLALVYGLALANHWPMIVLSTPALLCLLAPSWREILGALARPRAAGVVLALFCLGLSPYLYVWARSQADPVISWHGPIDSFGALVSFVTTSRDLRPEAIFPSPSWATRGQTAAWLVRETLAQHGLLAAALGALGFVWTWRRFTPARALALTWLYLATTFVLFAVLGLPYELLLRATKYTFPIVAYGALSLWVAAGTRAILERTPGPAAWVRAAGASVVVGSVLWTNGPVNDRRDDRWTHDYALAALSNLEPDAVLFTGDDTTTGPIGYYRLVEGVRPDVTLHHLNSLVFGERIHPYGADLATRKESVRRFLAETDRPVYSTSRLDHAYGREDLGLYRRVRKDLPRSAAVATAEPAIITYLAHATIAAPRHPFAIYHQTGLRANASRLLTPLVRLELEGEPTPAERRAYEAVQETFHGRLAALLYLVGAGALSEPDLLAFARETEARIDDRASIEERARLYQEMAMIAIRSRPLAGRSDTELAEILAWLERSLSIQPGLANRSVGTLLRLYERIDAWPNPRRERLRARIREILEHGRARVDPDRIGIPG